jgi:hypothetical protein
MGELTIYVFEEKALSAFKKYWTLAMPHRPVLI